MPVPPRERELRRAWGTFFLQLGVLLFLLLVGAGALGLARPSTDPSHLFSALSIMFGGPVVIALVIGGLLLRRRKA